MSRNWIIGPDHTANRWRRFSRMSIAVSTIDISPNATTAMNNCIVNFLSAGSDTETVGAAVTLVFRAITAADRALERVKVTNTFCAVRPSTLRATIC